MRRCHAIVFACTILNVFKNVSGFSIQGRYCYQVYQRSTTSTQNIDAVDTKQTYFRKKRNSKRDIRLNEKSIAAVQNELKEEFEVMSRSEKERYTSQSQATDRNGECTNASSSQPRLSSSFLNSVSGASRNYISDLQVMTLKSKITKFMVTSASGPVNTKKRFIILWRNLLNDTPELHGYPISFLSEQMKSLMRCIDQTSNTTTALSSIDLALQQITNDAEIDWDLVSPFLDAYTFEVGGGVMGLAYGVIGVADGTHICTSSVGDVQYTIPRNYILTGDGCFYELGRPAFSNESLSLVPQRMQSNSLISTTQEWFSNLKDTDSLTVENFRVDADLWQLAGLTTLVLSSAMAMETLSHHLTVNMFWV